MLPRSQDTESDKRREDSLSNYTMSDPPYVCSLAPTHPPLSFHRLLNIRSSPTRPRTRPHTCSHIRVRRFHAAATGCRFLLSPGISSSSSPPTSDGSFYCARASGSGNSTVAKYIGRSQLSRSLLFPSYYNSTTRTVVFWRLCCSNSSTLIRKKPLATRTHFKRAEYDSGKRRLEVKWAVWIMSMHRAFFDAQLSKRLVDSCGESGKMKNTARRNKRRKKTCT